MTEQLLRLPEKPGTVIAIGEWWLIRLRPYEGHPSAWEMLPLPSKELREHAQRNGASGQCIYGDEWVLAEVEQEGGYLIISDPRDEPSGIQYYKPSPAPVAAEETIVNIPIGTRVYLRAVDTMRGAVALQHEDGRVDVRWDNGSATTISQDYIGPEAIWNELATPTPPIGARVRLTRGEARGMIGTVSSHDTEPGYVKVRWDERPDTYAMVRQRNLAPERGEL